MIRFIIKIYIYILIVDSILSYFPQYQNKPWAKQIKQLADFTLKPVRSVLPDANLPFDISPIVVIITLNVLMLLW